MREKDLEYIKKYLPSDQVEEGISLLEKGVSPQYIVGNVDFYGNIIEVNSNVLIPRFETELLVEKTIMYIQRLFSKDKISNLKILDVGTGSGCIAITLKKELNSKVIGVDISLEALEVAKRNAIHNEADICFYQSDLFSNVSGKFDVIVSNPPYIRYDEVIEDIVKNNEPHLALYAGEQGLYFYRKILEKASNYLSDQFLIAFEIGERQGEAIKNMAHQYLDDVSVKIEKYYSGRDRFVFIIKGESL